MGREFKEGDVLTLKVRVYNGINGPAWALSEETTKYALPGNPAFTNSGKAYKEGFERALIAHESPLRVGDRVKRNILRPYQTGTIKAIDGEQYMVHWDNVRGWHPFDVHELKRIEDQ